MTAFPLSGSIDQIVRLWSTLLLRLEIPSNIRAFEWVGEIAAGEELAITHPLGLIPTRFIVADDSIGGILVRGSRAWTKNHVFIKNRASTTTFSGKVLVLP